jgi:hypothetical protein
MALDDMIDENEGIGRQPAQDSADPVADRSSVPECSPWLTSEEAAEAMRSGKDHEGFDRWRHLPTLELHYYPSGIEPANVNEYVRFLP